jgi:hypothetical protein
VEMSVRFILPAQNETPEDGIAPLKGTLTLIGSQPLTRD